ncbi:MAG: hypothetical protein GX868_16055 [Actinobacteria bacterium]|nr:hypothetical protein [Actinomycetota bacterium]
MVGTASAALVVASVAMLPTVSAQAGAEGFIPGEATATAKTMTISLSLGGGKPLEVGLGNTVARYQNRTATAEGSILSLGLLQLFFGPTSQCSELPPLIPQDQLPPITIGDSRRAVVNTPTEVRAPGSAEAPGGVLGKQTAYATAEPQRSDAKTELISHDFGLLALDGGTTEVTTSLNGTVREARAVTTGTRLRVLGDIFVINNPRWEAIARSGSVTTSEGRFTFDSATVFGIDRPAAYFKDDFLSLAGGFSQMLGFLGLKITYPEVIADEYGLVTVTPLTIGVENPPIGIDFLKPLFTYLAPAKETAWQDMIDEDCRNQGVLQIADLALGVLGGTGSASLGVGGVTAFTAATEFPEAAPIDIGDLDLGAGLDLGSSAPAPAPALEVAAPDFSSSNIASSVMDTSRFNAIESSMPVIEDTPIVADTTAAPPTTPASTAPNLPTANLASNRIIPGSKGGTAAVVGGIGLVGLLCLAGADRFIMRRTKREIPD